MRKKMLASVILLLVLVLIIASISFAVWSSKVEDTEIGEAYFDDWNESAKYFVYELQADETYKVVDYQGIITNVRVPNTYNNKNVTVIGGSWTESKIIQSLAISENVTKIEPYALMNCRNLKELYVFGAGNMVIGDYAFMGCNNLSIIKNDNLRVIIKGVETFKNCPKSL